MIYRQTYETKRILKHSGKTGESTNIHTKDIAIWPLTKDFKSRQEETRYVCFIYLYLLFSKGVFLIFNFTSFPIPANDKTFEKNNFTKFSYCLFLNLFFMQSPFTL